MATDSRVTPTGLIKVTTPTGEAHVDPAFIAMIGRGNGDGASIYLSGIATNPLLVSESPASVLALLKEGRAVQAVLRGSGRDSM